MLTLVAFLVVLSVLILVHEFGHFFAAKFVGIHAPRFSLGLGPRLWGFRVGETEFVLSAIPLGGYVKMAGMEDDEAAEGLEGGASAADPAEPPVDPSRTFDAKSLWARTLVISAGVIMNLLFAFLTYAFVAGVYGVPDYELQGVRADPTATGAAAAEVAKIPAGATIARVNGQAVNTRGGLYEALQDAPAGPLRIDLADGRAVTLNLASEGMGDDLVKAVEPYIPPVLNELIPARPAVKAGLLPGDRIVAVNGAPVTWWHEVVDVVRPSAGKPVRFDVMRDGKRMAFTVTPEAGKNDAGATVGRIGAGAVGGIERSRSVGFLESFQVGALATWNTTKEILTILGKMIRGTESARNMGGLLTIAQASGSAAAMGAEGFLLFLALFSVNLAIFNLLPIPVLDGGHLMFLAVEAVRGRPLSLEARVRLSHVGLFLVVALVVWANANDILRTFGI